MLRVLVLSTRFPDAQRPSYGNFVERQTLALAGRPDVEVEVVAPVGLPPFPFSLRRRHRALRELPAIGEWRGLTVQRPRYPYMPYLPRFRAQAMARALLPVMRQTRARFPFDILAAEFFWPDGAAAGRLARALRLPFTVKARGQDFERWAAHPATRRLALETGRAAAGLLAVSESVEAAMASFGLPPERIAVHRTGLDRSQFHPRDRSAAKAALKIEGPLLLCVGNLIARKRQSLAIEAMKLLDGVTLMIVGDGPDREALERQVRSAGLDRRVQIRGRIPHSLLPAFYAAADVTLHTAEAEGLANVWVESLACGTPVVATDAGGAREAINRPEAGRIAAPSAEAVAEAVREMLVSRPAAASVAEAVAQFSWERNAEELEAHLRRAVAAPDDPA